MTELSNFLADLAERAKEAHAAAYTAAEQTAIEKAMETASLLIAAKEACHHGEWLPFLARVGIGERKAQRLMQLAQSGMKSDTVTDLGGIKAALRYLSMTRLPGEGKWLIVDRAREDAQGQEFAYAVIKPIGATGLFELVIHTEARPSWHIWPVLAARVWAIVDADLPIPPAERVFLSVDAGYSAPADEQQPSASSIADMSIGRLPHSYVVAKHLCRDCIDDFSEERFQEAAAQIELLGGERDWWPNLPDILAMLAVDDEMTELSDEVYRLERQRRAEIGGA